MRYLTVAQQLDMIKKEVKFIEEPMVDESLLQVV
jgi:hypothetical protein